MSSKAAKILAENKEKPQAVHNACSGKHSGMLALCRMLGIPVEGYTKPDHQVQKIMHQSVAECAKISPEKLEIGIDGCGVPVFYLPLYNMSLAYARLAKPSDGDWREKEEDVYKRQLAGGAGLGASVGVVLGIVIGLSSGGNAMATVALYAVSGTVAGLSLIHI